MWQRGFICKGSDTFMFQVNDVVIYGNHGVCRVIGRGFLSISVADKEKEYYTLRPLYQKEAVIYVPVGGNKTVMRPVISKEEAERLIRDIPTLDALWTANERERESQYRTALKSCDCRELVKMIKALYERRSSRLKDGKKATAVDERYFRMAEEQLYQELAYTFGMEKEGVGPFIAGCIREKEKTVL